MKKKVKLLLMSVLLVMTFVFGIACGIELRNPPDFVFNNTPNDPYETIRLLEENGWNVTSFQTRYSASSGLLVLLDSDYRMAVISASTVTAVIHEDIHINYFVNEDDAILWYGRWRDQEGDNTNRFKLARNGNVTIMWNSPRVI
ncbi:MAG: hypothetical protein FWC11_01110 [Firmicutes bacterium]|nr:hypothetical protein [Bacillota bacterium]